MNGSACCELMSLARLSLAQVDPCIFNTQVQSFLLIPSIVNKLRKLINGRSQEIYPRSDAFTKFRIHSSYFMDSSGKVLWSHNKTPYGDYYDEIIAQMALSEFCIVALYLYFIMIH